MALSKFSMYFFNDLTSSIAKRVQHKEDLDICSAIPRFRPVKDFTRLNVDTILIQTQFVCLAYLHLLI